VYEVESTAKCDQRKTWASSDHQQSSIERLPIVEAVVASAGPVSTAKSTAAMSATVPVLDHVDAAYEMSAAGHKYSSQWSALIDAGNETSNAWAIVSPRRMGTSRTTAAMTSRPKASVKLTGSRPMSTSDQTVKAVPRKAVLSAYVGRLHKDTTEEALTEFLSDVGLKGVVCKKLKAKEGRVFYTSAFYVTCSADSKVLFYDETIWPEGAELRDWVYYN
jgi:hypothetical protein